MKEDITKLWLFKSEKLQSFWKIKLIDFSLTMYLCLCVLIRLRIHVTLGSELRLDLKKSTLHFYMIPKFAVKFVFFVKKTTGTSSYVYDVSFPNGLVIVIFDCSKNHLKSRFQFRSLFSLEIASLIKLI